MHMRNTIMFLFIKKMVLLFLLTYHANFFKGKISVQCVYNVYTVLQINIGNKLSLCTIDTQSGCFYSRFSG